MSRDGGKPLLQLRVECSENMNKWLVGETESFETFFKSVKTYVGWPDKTKWGRADFQKKKAAVCTPSRIGVNGATCEFPRGE
jgi:hypothetical protein